MSRASEIRSESAADCVGITLAVSITVSTINVGQRDVLDRIGHVSRQHDLQSRTIQLNATVRRKAHLGELVALAKAVPAEVADATDPTVSEQAVLLAQVVDADVATDDVGGEAGRSIVVGRHEDRIAAARAAQHEPPTRALLRRRAKVERKIDHLQDLGMRKARYRGRRKTKLQAFLAVTVAKLQAPRRGGPRGLPIYGGCGQWRPSKAAGPQRAQLRPRPWSNVFVGSDRGDAHTHSVGFGRQTRSWSQIMGEGAAGCPDPRGAGYRCGERALNSATSVT